MAAPRGLGGNSNEAYQYNQLELSINEASNIVYDKDDIGIWVHWAVVMRWTETVIFAAERAG